ncbi:MAG: adenylyl-sulfate kinase [Wolinella sp.]
MAIESGVVVWIMGLAGSGKSTLARAVYEELKPKMGSLVYLDGDEMRDIFESYEYDKESRIKIANRRALLCSLLASQGVSVITSAISMFNESYEFNRAHISKLIEIYVKCDIKELYRRDQKNLYTKASRGEIFDVVGIDIAFDEPRADLVIENSLFGDIGQKRDKIIDEILKRSFDETRGF